jgi:hypothetical protein
LSDGGQDGFCWPSERGSGIAPLERFVAPTGLAGEDGRNRFIDGDTATSACDDCQAILAWLADVASSDASYANLRNSAEKLLNWACFERRVALSSLEAEDLVAFMAFLNAPSPTELWVCPRSTRRASEAWRPFASSLCASSQRTVMRGIASLFRWMRQAHYAHMPFVSGLGDLRHGLGRQSGYATNLRRRKAEPLSRSAWRWVELQLADDVDSLPVATRLLLELLYFGGMKVVDVIHLRDSHCLAPTENFPLWRLYISSRPAEEPWVYALPPLASSLSEWFGTRTTSPRLMSLIPNDYESDRVLSGCGTLLRQVGLLLRRSGERAGRHSDMAAAKELCRATPHCLLHAMEIHSDSDWGFARGLVAHPRFKGAATIKYAERICVTRPLIERWWHRLRHLWDNYPEFSHAVSPTVRPAAVLNSLQWSSDADRKSDSRAGPGWYQLTVETGATVDAFRAMDRYIRAHVVPGCNAMIACWIANPDPRQIAIAVRDGVRARLAWHYILWAFTLEPTIQCRRWRDGWKCPDRSHCQIRLTVPVFAQARQKLVEGDLIQAVTAEALLSTWHLASLACRAVAVAGFVHWGPGTIRPDFPGGIGMEVAPGDRLTPWPRHSKEERTSCSDRADLDRRQHLLQACRGPCLTYFGESEWSVSPARTNDRPEPGVMARVLKLLGVDGRPKVMLFQDGERYVARLVAIPLQVRASSPKACFTLLRDACARYERRFGARWATSDERRAEGPIPSDLPEIKLFKALARSIGDDGRFWESGVDVGRIRSAFEGRRFANAAEVLADNGGVVLRR